MDEKNLNENLQVEGNSVTEGTEKNDVVDVNSANNNTTGEKTFTQAQVNDIVRGRLSQAEKGFYKALGIESKADYDKLVNEHESLKQKYQDLNEQTIFKDNHIKADKVDDIKAYYKGKGLEFTDTSLKEVLKTHNEWVEEAPSVTTIQQMGSTSQSSKIESDERSLASKLFGIKIN